MLYTLFFKLYRDHRDLHSFPTRRSSDLADVKLFEYAHPIKRIYSQSSSTVKTLIVRNRDRLLIERSEEHTSELQSRGHLVCRLLLEKKKKYQTKGITDNTY